MIYFFDYEKQYHAHCIKGTVNVHTRPFVYIAWQGESVNKSCMSVRALGNERGSNRTLTTVLTRRPRRSRKTETQPVCAQDFHDNNKLMGFTSHILFMLFDGVWGSLHWRKTLRRIHVFGWKKLLSPRPRRCKFVPIPLKCVRELFVPFLSRATALKPVHKHYNTKWRQQLMRDGVFA